MCAQDPQHSARSRSRARGRWAFPLLALWFCGSATGLAQVTTAGELVAAVEAGGEDAVITLAAGRFELAEPLRPKPGMTLRGAGVGATVLAPTPDRDPGLDGLPDGDTDHLSVRREAYLIDLGDRVENVTIAGMTLSGADRLHGAVHGNNSDGLVLHDLRIEDFVWSGVRTFRLSSADIYDVDFHDAGGKVDNKTGGGLYFTWAEDCDIHDNRFTKDDPDKHVFGVKGHQFRRTRIHHNTILVSFSIEIPFGNDEAVEIDHNVCRGVISIPKYAGGPEMPDGLAYHIHHNYLTRSYAMEWARNGVEVDHNLFDFDVADDKGNLVADFGSVVAPGPTRFHDNLIKNPGRGLFWSQGGYNNYSFTNNHVIANATATPRTDGLFGFNGATTDFSTIVIRDNIFELIGVSRPLLRNEASYGATVVNNTMINVADADRFDDGDTGDVRGPTETLGFYCGQHGEYRVDGWEATLVDTSTESGGQPAVDPAIWYHLENRAHAKLLQATEVPHPSGDACSEPSRVVRGTTAAYDGSWTHWRLTEAADAVYYLTNRGFEMRLQAADVPDEPAGRSDCGAEGALTTRMADIGCADDRVKWSLVLAAADYFYLYNAASDTYLQCLPGTAETEASLRQVGTDCADESTQWRLREVGEGADRNPTTSGTTSLGAPAPLVYPNPTRGRVTVAGVVGEVAVYDLLGQEVVRTSLDGRPAQLDLDVPPGIYTLYASRVTRRIVVE